MRVLGQKSLLVGRGCCLLLRRSVGVEIAVVAGLGLRLNRDSHSLEWVNKSMIVDVICDEVIIDRPDASRIDEVLSLEQVKALVLQILKERIFLFREKVTLVHLVVTAVTPCLRQLLLQGFLLGFSGRVRGNAFASEVAEQLAWDFLKSFFRELHWVVSEFPEGDELHDVGRHILLVSG